ncbi:hypothetical protein BSU04_45985 [Caballeronia sordidicola]|uniref:Uncharacterized protein n=1 Tax=Caballeronia sordidicola TaxID=196367 RepID=A0A226WKM1_CABSO|nr:hypothetical protein BSU04_45985 [Caballeronia sordidicola]
MAAVPHFRDYTAVRRKRRTGYLKAAIGAIRLLDQAAQSSRSIKPLNQAAQSSRSIKPLNQAAQ